MRSIPSPHVLWIPVLLAILIAPAEARNGKGDALYAQGRIFEERGEWDRSLAFYEEALSTEPAETMYKIGVNRARFQASQIHIARGRQLRQEGKLSEALSEFELALGMNPSSPSAVMEARETVAMMEEAQRREQRGLSPAPAITPAQQMKQEAEELIASAQPAPMLRPLSREPITLKINNQTPKVLFETVAKLAGLNIVFDPDFLRQQTQRLDFEVTGASLEQALDYLSVLTKAYWKPLSENTLFITLDNPTKRRDFQEHVTKVFYLENVTSVQELQEIATAVRAVTDLRKLFTYNSQNAIIVRGPSDNVQLAEKLIYDLDKAKSEVVVDVLLLEAARGTTRNLGASLISGSDRGLRLPIVFRPQTGGDDGGGTASGAVALGQLGKLTENDWSVTLPGAVLEALITSQQAQIMQSPQVRSLDGQKAELKIGDRVPIASGSFTAGVGSVGVSPLVNTQFQYIDVGVIVSLTPKVHSAEEVSVQVEIEVSTVRERINVGGLEQPVIGQRRVNHQIRIREGEVNLLGGLIQDQDSKSIAGLPWLSSLPIFGRFFSTERKERSQSELLIALVPHIVRTPDYKAYNLRGIATGTEQVVQMRYTPPVQPAAPTPGIAPAPGMPLAPGGAPAPGVPGPPAPGTAATPPTPAAPAPVMLTGPSTVKAGNPFTVELQVSNVQDLFTAPITVAYEPGKVVLSGIAEGTFLQQGGVQTIFTQNIRNDEGRATVNLNRVPGSAGVSGSGTLLRLTFQALAPGQATIRLDQMGLRNTRLEPIFSAAPSIQVTVEP